MFPAAHGAVCAALLPHVMSINVQALNARQPESEALGRYDEVARILTGRVTATAADGVAWVSALVADLEIPALAAYGVTRADFPVLVEKTAVASSTKANPITLTADELYEVLERAV